MTERKPAIPSRSLLQGMPYVRSWETNIGQRFAATEQDKQMVFVWDPEGAAWKLMVSEEGGVCSPEFTLATNVARINARSPTK
jgi:hypothetical protein